MPPFKHSCSRIKLFCRITWKVNHKRRERNLNATPRACLPSGPPKYCSVCNIMAVALLLAAALPLAMARNRQGAEGITGG